MTGTNNDLDRVRLVYAPPEDSYERLMKRRDRRRASSRIAAAAVASVLAVGALGAVAIAFRGPGDGTQAGSSRATGAPGASNLQARMVFERSQDGRRNLFIAGLDGSNPSRITTGVNDQAGDLSPDGTQVVYASEQKQGDTGLAVINLDGSGRTQLTTEFDYVPSWSPDGSRIAFARAGSDNAMSIFVMNADGSGVQRLTAAGNNDYGPPSWSPDGSQILFQRVATTGTQPGTDLWEMNADGSNAKLVLPDASDPQRSPNGTQIAFVRGANVWVMNGADKTSIQLTDLSPRPDAGDLVWSPDSKEIAFSHADAVWVVAVDGTGLHETGLPRGASPTSWGASSGG